MQNSWYLKNNGIHHFFCKCGEYNSIGKLEEKNSSAFEIIEFDREEIENSNIDVGLYYPDNQCSSCNNEHYLDVEALLFNNKTRYWKDVKWYYKELVTDEFWKVTAYMQIPHISNDFGKIDFKEVELASYTITTKGVSSFEETAEYFLKKYVMIQGNFLTILRIIKKEMLQKILVLLQSHPTQSLAWIDERVEKLEDLLFFLQNPNIRSFDMLKWKSKEYFLEVMNREVSVKNSLAYFRNYRSEKSILKIQFDTYKKMMEQYNGYNPMVDYIFSRTISDVNHLHKALTMDIKIKNRLFNHCAIENINYFIDFLKSHYEEKHIVQIWLNIQLDDLGHYLVSDTINLFTTQEMIEALTENFQKTSLTIIAMHDELMKHSRRLKRVQMKNVKFVHSKFLSTSEVTKETLTYRLPIDSNELYKWGTTLHNCLFTYGDSILSGKSTVFGIFIDNDLTYALEIRNNKIVQLSATCNKTLSKSERDKVKRWHKEVYMVNVMKLFR